MATTIIIQANFQQNPFYISIKTSYERVLVAVDIVTSTNNE